MELYLRFWNSLHAKSNRIISVAQCRASWRVSFFSWSGILAEGRRARGALNETVVMDNWQDIDSCFFGAPEAVSTRCGGQGVTVFLGMAKPVRAPQIGSAKGY